VASRQPKQVGEAGKRQAAPVEEEDDYLDLEPAQEDIYEELVEEAKKRKKKETVRYRVPSRPNISLEFDPNIEWEDWRAWVKKATKGRGEKAEVNHLLLAQIVLSRTTCGLYMKGVQVFDKKGDGEPLTLVSHRTHEIFNVPLGSTAAAISAVYGGDADPIKHCRLIIEAAGYDIDTDDMEAEDGPLAS